MNGYILPSAAPSLPIHAPKDVLRLLPALARDEHAYIYDFLLEIYRGRLPVSISW